MKELENLTAFWARTGGFIWDSLPHSGRLETNPNLLLKVGASGSMEPFAGNAVVFPLSEPVKRKIGRIRERLYQTCAPALAEPLEISSFHITLHDLLSGKPDQNLNGSIDRIRNPALACVRQISEKNETVCLHSTVLFNMVNTSMVLGFAPADEESCKRLMTYYELVQKVVHLDYPLTPHVTVAYFRPGAVTPNLVEELRNVVDEVGRQEKILIRLPAKAVEYVRFSDMNHYWRDI